MSNTEIKSNSACLPSPVDIFENESEYLFVADMPGVKPEDMVVELKDDELRLFGHRDDYGLRRVFRVPGGVDPESVTAELKAGVLEVHLPKPEVMRPRRIEVSHA